MKAFISTLLLALLAVSAKSQLFPITYFTGTTFFGSYGITVTSGGSVGTGGAPVCLGPILDQYWVGYPAGGVYLPGSYTYALSKPVYKIAIHSYGINSGPLGAGEYLSMSVNGAPYTLTPANVLSYTECMPGGGPCYLSTGFLMGPVGPGFPTVDYNGGDLLITSSTGIHSFECYSNGIESGVAYVVYLDTSVVNVCEGDTLHLYNPGDSTGATYSWTSPGGLFISSLQNPFVYPVLLTDSGLYQVIKTVGGVPDTFVTLVKVFPKPVVNVTNNSPLCAAGVSTLDLGVTPDSAGETFLWAGPSGFTSTSQFPTLTTFVEADTGIYFVYATTIYGCKNTGQTHVTVIPRPPTPVVTDENYCQGNTFVAYALSDTITGDTILWYTAAVGGTGSTSPITVPTSVPGLYYVWVSQKLGSCESLRGTDSVRVTTTPAAPGVSGTMQYCQYVGTINALTVTTTPTGTIRWYTVATGGSFTVIQPEPSISVAGTYNYWVSQIDSGCESLRTPVTIIIHPKPDTPVITPTPICQYKPAEPLQATLSPGDFPLWYGPGVTVGSTSPPAPGTAIAPDTVVYYVTETSIYGCVSDSAEDIQITKAKPPVPVTGDIKYCQKAVAVPLNRLVDSAGNSHLNWYYNATTVTNPPIPPTDTIPGVYTWYASQTINGCEGDSGAVNVAIIYLPVFGITASSPDVCQYDSLRLSYNGPLLPGAVNYMWTLPAGAIIGGGTSIYDSMIAVQFDTANQNNYVYLLASDDSGFCHSDTVIRINVIAQPLMAAYTKQDVCLGDTVQLGISGVGNNAAVFTWYVDNVLMNTSGSLNIITSNSNSGGPYQISWLDSGQHVIKVTSATQEGCKSNPAYDSVYVWTIPDATFKVTDSAICIDDSVLFVANTNNYNYSYEWSPAHYFNNINSATVYGRMENERSVITLTVTNPYGCTATASQELDPGNCCTIQFPNAFTPNTLTNNIFRPVPGSGYHNFHQFIIVNRWGQEVFNGGNSNQQWDGNYNGVPQDMGVYYYYVKYDCGTNTFETKGDVTLIR